MKRDRSTMVMAPRAIAAMTPGWMVRGEVGEAGEDEVGDGALGAVVFAAGMRVEPRRVGVVVVESRRRVGMAEVAKGVLSVKIALGRSVDENVAVAAEMSGREVADMSLMGTEGMSLALLSFQPVLEIANGGQRLVFEGSASGIMAMVKTCPEPSSGSWVV